MRCPIYAAYIVIIAELNTCLISYLFSRVKKQAPVVNNIQIFHVVSGMSSLQAFIFFALTVLVLTCSRGNLIRTAFPTYTILSLNLQCYICHPMLRHRHPEMRSQELSQLIELKSIIGKWHWGQGEEEGMAEKSWLVDRPSPGVGWNWSLTGRPYSSPPKAGWPYTSLLRSAPGSSLVQIQIALLVWLGHYLR